jgi:hypothetical protein
MDMGMDVSMDSEMGTDTIQIGTQTWKIHEHG